MLSLKEGLDILQTSFVDCSLRAQVVSNDLSRGLFPARDLRLLVVDEAHRAQGDYAYCHVVRELTREARMEREWNQHCSHCNKLTHWSHLVGTPGAAGTLAQMVVFRERYHLQWSS